MLSTAFFIPIYSFSIVSSIFGLFISTVVFFAIVCTKQCHTKSNLLICNICLASFTHSANSLIVSFYGFREDWAANQPLCTFRAYIFFCSCGICSHSYISEALSRLFLTVYYQHKYLVTYKVYWCMIVANWTIPTLLLVVPLFFSDTYIYEVESRLCTFSTKNFWMATYMAMSAFMIPFNLSIIIYSIIINYARSSGRVTAISTHSASSRMLNLRRELKVARNMLILTIAYASGGIPYFVLLFWNKIPTTTPPSESLYLLSIIGVVFAVPAKVIIIFFTNKQVRDTCIAYLRCRRGRIGVMTNK